MLWFEPATVSPEGLKRRLTAAGYPPAQADSAPAAPWRNPKVLSSLVAGLLLAVGWGLGRLGVISELSIGAYVAAMVIAAAAMGEPGEGATLVFLYSISEAAEGYTADKTRSAIRALMKLVPPTATVRREGKEIEVPAESLQPGDVFIVRPGGSIPTDGEIAAAVMRSSMPITRSKSSSSIASRAK